MADTDGMGVEWTRLEGGQVEAVVAMFVNRERPDSVRITPSRGDGGVDILDRGGGPDGTDVVYQVKRYTDTLTSKQKRDIEGSLSALATDKRWEGLSVREWRLVTPWDPSPEAEIWLQGLGNLDMRKIWHGLTWADQKAANYADVVDYYLHGGRALVETAHLEVAALFGAENTSGDLSVPGVQRRLECALQVLEHDPHYRYEHHFGQGPPPPDPRYGDRPGLVIQFQDVDPDGGRWNTVDIIARCAASVDERPITIKGTLRAAPDSDLAHEIDAFSTYGAPFTSPEGAFDGDLDAPGGLGGPLKEGTIRIGPTADHDLGDNPDMHFEVLDPAGAPLAAVDIRRIERSQGIRGGVRIVLEEVHRLFVIEDRYDLKQGRGSRSVRLGDWTGTPVRPALAGARFLSALHSPNKLRLSVQHAAPSKGVVDNNIGFDCGEDMTNWLHTATRILEVLTTLQEHAAAAILTPELGAVTQNQFAGWRRAAALLGGEELSATYPEGECVVVRLDSDVTVAEDQALRILLPLNVHVGEHLVDLGHQEMVLAGPTLVERRAEGDGVLHAFTTADRTIRLRRHDPTDEGESAATDS
ncbi:MAG: restriction endonuclease [Angustibacter sp.]